MVIESCIINEFIDEAWPDKEVSLLPPLSQPSQRAKARLWVDFVNSRLVPPFYKILQKQEKSEQDAAASELITHLRNFIENMDPEGPFFMGDSLGLVDIAYAPWSVRFFVLERFRGFQVPVEGEVWKRFARWRQACADHPSVRQTLQNDDDLLASYDRYAKNTAKSLVADAINANKPLP